MMLEDRIAAARGEREVDLLLRNAKLVNVFSGEIYDTDVAVFGGRIVGFGDYPAGETIDLEGRLLMPGFIDGHVHVESSMVRISEYARAVMPAGTTSIIVDPHEIANVMGLDGIQYMMKSAELCLLDVYFMMSSCVPATHMETAGSILTSFDISAFMTKDRVIGLAEVMNFPGVLARDTDLMDKLRLMDGQTIDGHAPGLGGRDLSAYVAAGVRSDHECTSLNEAAEKLRSGMYIMIREGSSAKNLDALLPLINDANASRIIFCTDDRHPEDLLDEGHIDSMIRRAVAAGVDPVAAVRIATLNAAEYFGLHRTGAVLPGFQADMAVIDDFESFNVHMVIKNGKLVAENGRFLEECEVSRDVSLRSSINVHWLEPEHFQIRLNDEAHSVEQGVEKRCPARVIEVIPSQIFTRKRVEEIPIIAGVAVSDSERDILKIAVIERHMASGNMGLGFVKGFGLQRGAIASSVAHDSHNIIVVGVNDSDMLAAVVQIARMRGGLCAVVDGVVVGALPLPIAGLISDEPLKSVRDRIYSLNRSAREMGSALKDPFMQLSFLALPVIPELKLTDKGLVDVDLFDTVPLWITDETV